MGRVKGQGPRVRVSNENKKFRVNCALIKRVAEEVLAEAAKYNKSAVEILFVDDRRIRALNKRYKKSNRPTDVLSFELDGCGLVAISLDTAADNADIFHTSVEEEAVLYVIHGILHLFGYDDGTAGKKERMDKRQLDLLEKICTKEILSRVLTPR
jgi:probable rRNA maturation factor